MYITIYILLFYPKGYHYSLDPVLHLHDFSNTFSLFCESRLCPQPKMPISLESTYYPSFLVDSVTLIYRYLYTHLSQPLDVHSWKTGTTYLAYILLSLMISLLCYNTVGIL